MVTAGRGRRSCRRDTLPAIRKGRATFSGSIVGSGWRRFVGMLEVSSKRQRRWACAGSSWQWRGTGSDDTAFDEVEDTGIVRHGFTPAVRSNRPHLPGGALENPAVRVHPQGVARGEFAGEQHRHQCTDSCRWLGRTLETDTPHAPRATPIHRTARTGGSTAPARDTSLYPASGRYPGSGVPEAEPWTGAVRRWVHSLCAGHIAPPSDCRRDRDYTMGIITFFRNAGRSVRR